MNDCFTTPKHKQKLHQLLGVIQKCVFEMYDGKTIYYKYQMFITNIPSKG